jgi:hypothetical protein
LAGFLLAVGFGYFLQAYTLTKLSEGYFTSLFEKTNLTELLKQKNFSRPF